MKAQEGMSKSGNGNASSAEKIEVNTAHLKAAALHYMEAAKFHENGDYDKAALSMVTAQRHVELARQVEPREETYTEEYGASRFLYEQHNQFLFKEANHEDYYFFTH